MGPFLSVPPEKSPKRASLSCVLHLSLSRAEEDGAIPSNMFFQEQTSRMKTGALDSEQNRTARNESHD